MVATVARLVAGVLRWRQEGERLAALARPGGATVARPRRALAIERAIVYRGAWHVASVGDVHWLM
eukprot:SAG11_NODE_2455_length_3343_cov_2.469482_1_plen_64_part_10